VSEWQDISTAPKDGTIIMLGRLADEDCDAISIPGFYEEALEDGQDYMGHDAGFVDMHYNDIIWGRSFGNPSYRHPGRQPTHWCPLPEPPK
jgi:hypothetical protein